MENITQIFNETYHPSKALLIYHTGKETTQVYVEAYDINKKGKPVNAHPLSMLETQQLAESLNTGLELSNNYLKSSGILPDKVLHLNPSLNGFAIWFTPEQEVNLLFVETLGIPSGKAYVPPLIWKAGKDELEIYAVKNRQKPTLKTPLFRAPFFNLHTNHKVCMGTVETAIDSVNNLEDFLTRWEQCYWNSYFSHMIAGISPVKGNVVQLWQAQVNTHQKFPLDELVETGKTLKNLFI